MTNYERINEKVKRILDGHRIKTPPINAKEIAEACGVSVEFKEFTGELSEISGILDFEREIIFVNSDDSPARQNFTIAHELGHWILHKDKKNNYNVLYRKAVGVDEESCPLEQEANAFAAELLVPMNMLDELRKQIQDESELARMFFVESDVISYRLKTGHG